MNTANKLTIFRTILIPVYLVVWYLDFPERGYVALAIFILASGTDYLDGYVARRYHQITDFGKFMDPLADKMLVLTAMICFCATGKLPVWTVVLVMAREFAVSGLRLVAVDNGRVIAAAWSGKVKTFATMVCLCLMHLPLPEVFDWVWAAVIAVTTLYSGVEYFFKNQDIFQDGRSK